MECYNPDYFIPLALSLLALAGCLVWFGWLLGQKKQPSK